MHVESCCQALLAELLPRVDPERIGWAVDIGVGTFALYWELFDQLGFRTVAVEPLPVDEVRRACRERGIWLDEVCVSDVDGAVPIYVGAFNGKENLNVSSLRPDWWGSTTTSRQVRSVRLATLLNKHDVQTLSCLKVDVEGMEHVILKQLPELREDVQPTCLMFEYGGGATMREGLGGWSGEILGGTMAVLRLLRRMGYGQTLVIDKRPDSREQLFDLQTACLQSETLFHPESMYGNIITLRRHSFDVAAIAKTCETFR